MKPLPRTLWGFGSALALAASLASSGCAESGYSSNSSSGYYRVGGRYYHCHPGGVCHNARHANYYFVGGVYRPRPGHYHHRPPHYHRPPHHHVRPRPLPARPRPR
ncbi:hypothetical protein [Microbulbifer aggregans]|uniref:hypothetical protein n=1 Tax=Microbulbifer aggregans TaxID=1769779 RepID=UPI0011AB52B7|nr:hypothetical protein [Microbulbifer aggregans]